MAILPAISQTTQVILPGVYWLVYSPCGMEGRYWVGGPGPTWETDLTDTMWEINPTTGALTEVFIRSGFHVNDPSVVRRSTDNALMMYHTAANSATMWPNTVALAISTNNGATWTDQGSLRDGWLPGAIQVGSEFWVYNYVPPGTGPSGTPPPGSGGGAGDLRGCERARYAMNGTTLLGLDAVTVENCFYVTNPSVRFWQGMYVMLTNGGDHYSIAGPPHAQTILIAVSSDGLTFTGTQTLIHTLTIPQIDSTHEISGGFDLRVLDTLRFAVVFSIVKRGVPIGVPNVSDPSNTVTHWEWTWALNTSAVGFGHSPFGYYPFGHTGGPGIVGGPREYYATTDIAGVDQPYLGLIKSESSIETAIADPLYGVIDYSELHAELLNSNARFTPTYVRNLRSCVCTAKLLDETSGTLLTTWTGRLYRTSMQGAGDVSLAGASYAKAVLSQLVPTGSTVTTALFPYAIPGDLGKTAPIVFGSIEKLKCLYVNDGNGGHHDYIVMRGAGATVNAVWRDDFDQGTTGQTSGAQSFRIVASADYTLSQGIHYPGYSTLRFPARQVNDSGTLVGIYVDVQGFQAEKNPIRGVQYLLSMPTDAWGLGQPINLASFDTAADQWAALTSPDTTSLDIVLGAGGQRRPAQEYLREWLLITGAYLGLDQNGAWTITLDVPPATTFPLGSSPYDGEQNIITGGERVWTSEEDRAQRVTARYRLSQTTNTYQLEVSRALDTTGREIVLDFPSIRSSRMADRVVDRIAKRLYYGQEQMRGVETTLEGWLVSLHDWVTYTHRPTGCVQDVFRPIKISKSLRGARFDLERVSPAIWHYTPAALPPEPASPPLDAGPPGVAGGVIGEGIVYVQTGAVAAPATYQPITTWVTVPPAITIATTGNGLYLQAYVELLVVHALVGASGMIRLRDTTSGANIEVGPNLFEPDTHVYPGTTVYVASFPSVILSQSSVTAGLHTIVLELQTNTGADDVFYGTRYTPHLGTASGAYVLMRETAAP